MVLKYQIQHQFNCVYSFKIYFFGYKELKLDILNNNNVNFVIRPKHFYNGMNVIKENILI